MIPYQENATVAAIVAPAPVQPASTLDALASRIVGRPVTVRCKPGNAYWNDPVVASYIAANKYAVPLGYADPPASYIVLPGATCDAITSELISDPSGRSFPGSAWITDDAVDVFTFFHEVSHVAEYPDGPFADEHATDCHALAIEPGELVALGVPARRRSWFERIAATFHANAKPPYAGPCS